MKAKYFLFSDDEYFHREIEATNWRQALAVCRDWFQIKGRLVIKHEYSNCREYKLVNSDYSFTLRFVD